MLTRGVRWCLCLALVQWSASDACAQASQPADLARIVEQSVSAYTKALAGNDPKAVGVLFTDEAEYIDDDGVVFHGRAAIESEFAAVQKVRPKGEATIEVISVRPIGPGLLTEDGVSTFSPENDGPISSSRYSAIHTRQPDGQWLIASLRVLGSEPVSAHERLKTLAFLLGRWRQESGNATVDTEWSWSADGQFLVSRFTSKLPDGTNAGGSHRIGWDPERQQFRSWVFGSDGSSGEGYWMDSENGWSVRLEVMTSRGTRATSVVSYVTDGKDALVITQGMEPENDAFPSFSSRLVRQPPAPSKPGSSR